MSLFVDNLFSGPATDTSSTPASLGSTPPTTVADTDSQLSDTSKHDVITVAADAIHAAPLEAQEPTPSQSPPPSRRPKRARMSEPVYNLAKLSGTHHHGKRRAKGDIVVERRRRTISGDTLVGSIEVAGDGSKTQEQGSDASISQWSSPGLNTPRTRRQAQIASPRATRLSSRLTGVSSFAATLSNMTKKGRRTIKKGTSRMSRELRRLQDTNEFSGVEDRPVLHTVWSNGKYVDPNAPAPEPARKRAKVSEQPKMEASDEEEEEPDDATQPRRAKKYLVKGLYAGQDMPSDVLKGLTMAEKKKLANLPEFALNTRVNTVMPSPIYLGLRMLIAGRDFKLPFNVCNPMPPGQPKPDEWKKMTKNRFIGDSKDYWRKMPHLHDLSKCVCKPDDGCGDNCQNRIMLYECDAGNCNVGKELCTNRSFADLAARRAKGGKYRVGVEVIKTSDRGYGVRSNRCFEPNQIIMEYTGEIITEEECERRMNEEYKNNECYYLMSFDQNMIIDATTGSIARFVNHSCNPNCRMIKWIVSGQPRMALFAGDRPIMTGDELTYDYNFDPFSAKNVQSCLCGESNCRGVLGPKSRDVKPAKADLNKVVKAAVKAGKRKLKELVGDEEAEGGKAKKRKPVPAKAASRSISKASLQAAKGAASVVKKGVTSLGLKGKKTTARAKALPVVIRGRATTATTTTTTTGAVVKKTSSSKVVKKKASGARLKQVSSRASSMTIVALTDEKAKPVKKVKGSPVSSKKGKGSPTSVKKAKASPALSKKGKGSPRSVQRAKRSPASAKQSKGSPASGKRIVVMTSKAQAAVKGKATPASSNRAVVTPSKVKPVQKGARWPASTTKAKGLTAPSGKRIVVLSSKAKAARQDNGPLATSQHSTVATPTQLSRPSSANGSPRRIIKLSPKAKANAVIRLVRE